MKRLRFCFLSAALILFFAVKLALIGQEAHFAPKVGREGLENILVKENFSAEDYQILMEQTGLGRAAVDELKAGEAFSERVRAFQEQYFSPVHYESDSMFPTAREERLVYQDGNEREIELAPLHDGDIILTRATHTMLWRHGHAAIVTDAQNEETLESVVLGEKSSFQTLEKWKSYPSVLVLRAKDAEVGRQAAKYAKEHLSGIDYSLFVGIKKKDKQNMSQIDSTQCAHLVWQAYRASGIDIDSNGGWLVLPKDIINSKELDIVQIFGFSPEILSR